MHACSIECGAEWRQYLLRLILLLIINLRVLDALVLALLNRLYWVAVSSSGPQTTAVNAPRRQASYVSVQRPPAASNPVTVDGLG